MRAKTQPVRVRPSSSRLEWAHEASAPLAHRLQCVASMGNEKRRRGFLVQAGNTVMGCALVASYGTCGYVGVRYIAPASANKRRMFVGDVAGFSLGAALPYELPNGTRLTVARRREEGTSDDFVALSSTCPHLGCKVSWQANLSRFFCPCHNGAFDAEGQPTEGPPKADDTPLVRYPLVVEDGLLFIELTEEQLA